MVVKSYRGLLADGGEEKIRLGTPDGRTGYRIIKFEVMTKTPGQVDHAEHIVKIYKAEQSTEVGGPGIDGTVNFSDLDLLGAAATFNRTDASAYYPTTHIIFENEIFNQDIFITHFEAINAIPCNYYIELEVIKLSTAQAEVLIVKDLRREPWTRP